jgi:hypothetical protein
MVRQTTQLPLGAPADPPPLKRQTWVNQFGLAYRWIKEWLLNL